MENKKYLNEETYQKNKKKVTKLSLIVMIVGIIIGLGLIITGLVLSHNVDKNNININSKQENSEPLRTEAEVQADINTIKPKLNSLQSEIDAIELELMKIQITEGRNDNYYAKQQEKENKETELLNLNSKLNEYNKELIKIKSNNQIDGFEDIFNTTSNNISKAKYMPFYFIGAFVIIASCLIAGSIYMFANKREIMAFKTQQVMPLAKESIEEMTPTIGNAAGTISKEIAKGIKEGFHEINQKNNKR